MKVLHCSDQTCHNFSLASLLIFLNQSNPKHSNLNNCFNNTDLKFREILHPMQVKCWTHQHLLSAFTTKSQVEILSALLSLHIIQICCKNAFSVKKRLTTSFMSLMLTMLFYLIPSHWFLLISHTFSGNLPVIVTFKPRNTFPPCGKDGSIQFEIKVDIKPEDVDNCNLLLCNSILWNLVCFYV